MSFPWSYRSTTFVLDVIHYIAERSDDHKVLWTEVLDRFTTEKHAWRTVEKVLYELCAFGVIQRIGKPADRRRGDTRALTLTTLGRAWLDAELIPIPTTNEEP